MILTLKSESLYNSHQNLLESDFESSTISFCDPNHLSLLLTSNFYSVLFFSSEIWQLSTLNSSSEFFLSASASAPQVMIMQFHLKTCTFRILLDYTKH